MAASSSSSSSSSTRRSGRARKPSAKAAALSEERKAKERKRNEKKEAKAHRSRRVRRVQLQQAPDSAAEDTEEPDLDVYRQGKYAIEPGSADSALARARRNAENTRLRKERSARKRTRHGAETELHTDVEASDGEGRQFRAVMPSDSDVEDSDTAHVRQDRLATDKFIEEKYKNQPPRPYLGASEEQKASGPIIVVPRGPLGPRYQRPGQRKSLLGVYLSKSVQLPEAVPANEHHQEKRQQLADRLLVTRSQPFLDLSYFAHGTSRLALLELLVAIAEDPGYITWRLTIRDLQESVPDAKVTEIPPTNGDVALVTAILRVLSQRRRGLRLSVAIQKVWTAFRTSHRLGPFLSSAAPGVTFGGLLLPKAPSVQAVLAFVLEHLVEKPGGPAGVSRRLAVVVAEHWKTPEQIRQLLVGLGEDTARPVVYWEPRDALASAIGPRWSVGANLYGGLLREWRDFLLTYPGQPYRLADPASIRHASGDMIHTFASRPPKSLAERELATSRLWEVHGPAVFPSTGGYPEGRINEVRLRYMVAAPPVPNRRGGHSSRNRGELLQATPAQLRKTEAEAQSGPAALRVWNQRQNIEEQDLLGLPYSRQLAVEEAERGGPGLVVAPVDQPVADLSWALERQSELDTTPASAQQESSWAASVEFASQNLFLVDVSNGQGTAAADLAMSSVPWLLSRMVRFMASPGKIDTQAGWRGNPAVVTVADQLVNLPAAETLPLAQWLLDDPGYRGVAGDQLLPGASVLWIFLDPLSRVEAARRASVWVGEPDDDDYDIDMILGKGASMAEKERARLTLRESRLEADLAARITPSSSSSSSGESGLAPAKDSCGLMPIQDMADSGAPGQRSAAVLVELAHRLLIRPSLSPELATALLSTGNRYILAVGETVALPARQQPAGWTARLTGSGGLARPLPGSNWWGLLLMKIRHRLRPTPVLNRTAIVAGAPVQSPRRPRQGRTSAPLLEPESRAPPLSLGRPALAPRRPRRRGQEPRVDPVAVPDDDGPPALTEPREPQDDGPPALTEPADGPPVPVPEAEEPEPLEAGDHILRHPTVELKFMGPPAGLSEDAAAWVAPSVAEAVARLRAADGQHDALLVWRGTSEAKAEQKLLRQEDTARQLLELHESATIGMPATEPAVSPDQLEHPHAQGQDLYATLSLATGQLPIGASLDEAVDGPDAPSVSLVRYNTNVHRQVQQVPLVNDFAEAATQADAARSQGAPWRWHGGSHLELRPGRSGRDDWVPDHLCLQDHAPSVAVLERDEDADDDDTDDFTPPSVAEARRLGTLACVVGVSDSTARVVWNGSASVPRQGAFYRTVFGGDNVAGGRYTGAPVTVRSEAVVEQAERAGVTRTRLVFSRDYVLIQLLTALTEPIGSEVHGGLDVTLVPTVPGSRLDLQTRRGWELVRYRLACEQHDAKADPERLSLGVDQAREYYQEGRAALLKGEPEADHDRLLRVATHVLESEDALCVAAAFGRPEDAQATTPLVAGARTDRFLALVDMIATDAEARMYAVLDPNAPGGEEDKPLDVAALVIGSTRDIPLEQRQIIQTAWIDALEENPDTVIYGSPTGATWGELARLLTYQVWNQNLEVQEGRLARAKRTANGLEPGSLEGFPDAEQLPDFYRRLIGEGHTAATSEPVGVVLCLGPAISVAGAITPQLVPRPRTDRLAGYMTVPGGGGLADRRFRFALPDSGRFPHGPPTQKLCNLVGINNIPPMAWQTRRLWPINPPIALGWPVQRDSPPPPPALVAQLAWLQLRLHLRRELDQKSLPAVLSAAQKQILQPNHLGNTQAVIDIDHRALVRFQLDMQGVRNGSPEETRHQLRFNQAVLDVLVSKRDTRVWWPGLSDEDRAIVQPRHWRLEVKRIKDSGQPWPTASDEAVVEDYARTLVALELRDEEAAVGAVPPAPEPLRDDGEDALDGLRQLPPLDEGDELLPLLGPDPELEDGVPVPGAIPQEDPSDPLDPEGERPSEEEDAGLVSLDGVRMRTVGEPGNVGLHSEGKKKKNKRRLPPQGDPAYGELVEEAARDGSTQLAAKRQRAEVRGLDPEADAAEDGAHVRVQLAEIGGGQRVDHPRQRRRGAAPPLVLGPVADPLLDQAVTQGALDLDARHRDAVANAMLRQAPGKKDVPALSFAFLMSASPLAASVLPAAEPAIQRAAASSSSSSSAPSAAASIVTSADGARVTLTSRGLLSAKLGDYSAQMKVQALRNLPVALTGALVGDILMGSSKTVGAGTVGLSILVSRDTGPGANQAVSATGQPLSAMPVIFPSKAKVDAVAALSEEKRAPLLESMLLHLPRFKQRTPGTDFGPWPTQARALAGLQRLAHTRASQDPLSQWTLADKVTIDSDPRLRFVLLSATADSALRKRADNTLINRLIDNQTKMTPAEFLALAQSGGERQKTLQLLNANYWAIRSGQGAKRLVLPEGVEAIPVDGLVAKDPAAVAPERQLLSILVPQVVPSRHTAQWLDDYAAQARIDELEAAKAQRLASRKANLEKRIAAEKAERERQEAEAAEAEEDDDDEEESDEDDDGEAVGSKRRAKQKKKTAAKRKRPKLTHSEKVQRATQRRQEADRSVQYNSGKERPGNNPQRVARTPLGDLEVASPEEVGQEPGHLAVPKTDENNARQYTQYFLDLPLDGVVGPAAQKLGAQSKVTEEQVASAGRRLGHLEANPVFLVEVIRSLIRVGGLSLPGQQKGEGRGELGETERNNLSLMRFCIERLCKVRAFVTSAGTGAVSGATLALVAIVEATLDFSFLKPRLIVSLLAHAVMTRENFRFVPPPGLISGWVHTAWLSMLSRRIWEPEAVIASIQPEADAAGGDAKAVGERFLFGSAHDTRRVWQTPRPAKAAGAPGATLFLMGPLCERVGLSARMVQRAYAIADGWRNRSIQGVKPVFPADDPRSNPPRLPMPIWMALNVSAFPGLLFLLPRQFQLPVADAVGGVYLPLLTKLAAVTAQGCWRHGTGTTVELRTMAQGQSEFAKAAFISQVVAWYMLHRPQAVEPVAEHLRVEQKRRRPRAARRFRHPKGLQRLHVNFYNAMMAQIGRAVQTYEVEDCFLLERGVPYDRMAAVQKLKHRSGQSLAETLGLDSKVDDDDDDVDRAEVASDTASDDEGEEEEEEDLSGLSDRQRKKVLAARRQKAKAAKSKRVKAQHPRHQKASGTMKALVRERRAVRGYRRNKTDVSPEGELRSFSWRELVYMSNPVTFRMLAENQPSKNIILAGPEKDNKYKGQKLKDKTVLIWERWRWRPIGHELPGLRSTAFEKSANVLSILVVLNPDEPGQLLVSKAPEVTVSKTDALASDLSATPELTDDEHRRAVHIALRFFMTRSSTQDSTSVAVEEPEEELIATKGTSVPGLSRKQRDTAKQARRDQEAKTREAANARTRAVLRYRGLRLNSNKLFRPFGFLYLGTRSDPLPAQDEGEHDPSVDTEVAGEPEALDPPKVAYSDTVVWSVDRWSRTTGRPANIQEMGADQQWYVSYLGLRYRVDLREPVDREDDEGDDDDEEPEVGALRGPDDTRVLRVRMRFPVATRPPAYAMDRIAEQGAGMEDEARDGDENHERFVLWTKYKLFEPMEFAPLDEKLQQDLWNQPVDDGRAKKEYANASEIKLLPPLRNHYLTSNDAEYRLRRDFNSARLELAYWTARAKKLRENPPERRKSVTEAKHQTAVARKLRKATAAVRISQERFQEQQELMFAFVQARHDPNTYSAELDPDEEARNRRLFWEAVSALEILTHARADRVVLPLVGRHSGSVVNPLPTQGMADAIGLLFKIAARWPTVLRASVTMRHFDVLDPAAWALLRRTVAVLLRAGAQHQPLHIREQLTEQKRGPWFLEQKDVWDRNMLPHQAVIARRLQFKPRALLVSRVGSGKTLNMMTWLSQRETAWDYCFWITPRSTLKSLEFELKGFVLGAVEGAEDAKRAHSRMGLLIPRHETGRYWGPESTGTSLPIFQEPRRSAINILPMNMAIHLDAFRSRYASSSICVVDEVHELKPTNQGGRAAVDFARTCGHGVLLASGTLIRDTVATEVLPWLRVVIPYELNHRNFLTALSTTVGGTYDTGIALYTTHLEADRALLRPGEILPRPWDQEGKQSVAEVRRQTQLWKRQQLVLDRKAVLRVMARHVLRLASVVEPQEVYLRQVRSALGHVQAITEIPAWVEREQKTQNELYQQRLRNDKALRKVRRRRGAKRTEELDRALEKLLSQKALLDQRLAASRALVENKDRAGQDLPAPRNNQVLVVVDNRASQLALVTALTTADPNDRELKDETGRLRRLAQNPAKVRGIHVSRPKPDKGDWSQPWDDGGPLNPLDPALVFPPVARIQKGAIAALDMTDRTVADGKSNDYRVVVITPGEVHGYNLTRCGRIVTSVYHTTTSQRRQLDGRLDRLGQSRLVILKDVITTNLLTLQGIRQANEDVYSLGLQSVLRKMNVDLHTASQIMGVPEERLQATLVANGQVDPVPASDPGLAPGDRVAARVEAVRDLAGTDLDSGDDDGGSVRDRAGHNETRRDQLHAAATALPPKPPIPQDRPLQLGVDGDGDFNPFGREEVGDLFAAESRTDLDDQWPWAAPGSTETRTRPVAPARQPAAAAAGEVDAGPEAPAPAPAEGSPSSSPAPRRKRRRLRKLNGKRARSRSPTPLPPPSPPPPPPDDFPASGLHTGPRASDKHQPAASQAEEEEELTAFLDEKQHRLAAEVSRRVNKLAGTQPGRATWQQNAAALDLICQDLDPSVSELARERRDPDKLVQAWQMHLFSALLEKHLVPSAGSSPQTERQKVAQDLQQAVQDLLERTITEEEALRLVDLRANDRRAPAWNWPDTRTLGARLSEDGDGVALDTVLALELSDLPRVQRQSDLSAELRSVLCLCPRLRALSLTGWHSLREVPWTTLAECAPNLEILSLHRNPLLLSLAAESDGPAQSRLRVLDTLHTLAITGPFADPDSMAPGLQVELDSVPLGHLRELWLAELSVKGKAGIAGWTAPKLKSVHLGARLAKKHRHAINMDHVWKEPSTEHRVDIDPTFGLFV